MFGNPHSLNPTSTATTELVEQARAAVLAFVRAPDEYVAIFTPNATGALHLVGEAYSRSGGVSPRGAARSAPVTASWFGRKHWRPAQIKAGIEPVRGLYDRRHTYATFALRAGVPVFAVSRFIGTSIAMIDRHYGHLANDRREHAVALLDALAFERAVDAAWTSPRTPLKTARKPTASARVRRSRPPVDALWTPRLVSVASTDD